MLQVTSLEAVRTLGRFLMDAGYNVSNLHDRLGLSDLPHPTLQNLQMLLYRTGGDDVLSALARLFFVGEPMEVRDCSRLLGEDVVRVCAEAGLLEEEGGRVRSQFALLPFASSSATNSIVCCDAVWTRSGNAEVILGPSETTVLLSKFLIRERSQRTLDLGTGTGVLAIDAATYSDGVVASDINPRAIEFATFNAVLNSVDGFLTAQGDAFVPIGEAAFDRVIANPPFFLSPSKIVTFCDSPMELDGFCGRLAREAPVHLEDGGYFQMICEWVQIQGENWEQRLRDWTDNSGCDVLVLQGTQLTPVNYASKRLAEARILYSGQHESSFVDRMQYFKERQVEGIVGGIITMRKRSGTNWFCVAPMPDLPDLSAGVAVAGRFAMLDLIFLQPESKILEAKLRLTRNTVLEQQQLLTENGWQTASISLRSVNGLKDRLGLDGTVAQITSLFNGALTVQEIAQTVAARLNLSADEATTRCLRLAKRLLTGNFVEPV